MRFRAKVLQAGQGVRLVEIDADGEAELRHVVEAMGAKLVSAAPVRRTTWRAWMQGPFDVGVFNQQLVTLLDAGQAVTDAVEVLGKNDRRPANRAVYASLLSSLKQGRQLSAAMAQLPSVFPVLYVAMVEASETTGTVKSAIRRYIQYQTQADEIKARLNSAAIYPTILAFVGFFVIGFLLLYVAPKFSAVFDDIATAKQSAAGMIQLWGSFVREYQTLAWSAFIGMFAGLAALLLHSSTRALVFRKLLDAPWLGERIWILHLGRLYRTLGMLSNAGVSIISAMRMTEASLPTGLQPQLRRATKDVSEGKSLSTSMMEHALCNEVAQRLLLAGESSGNLAEMLDRIADFFDRETAGWVDKAGRLIEPILMVVIGLIIGAVVLMLYSPIFDLANAV